MNTAGRTDEAAQLVRLAMERRPSVVGRIKNSPGLAPIRRLLAAELDALQWLETKSLLFPCGDGRFQLRDGRVGRGPGTCGAADSEPDPWDLPCLASPSRDPWLHQPPLFRLGCPANMGRYTRAGLLAPILRTVLGWAWDLEAWEVFAFRINPDKGEERPGSWCSRLGDDYRAIAVEVLEERESGGLAWLVDLTNDEEQLVSLERIKIAESIRADVVCVMQDARAVVAAPRALTLPNIRQSPFDALPPSITEELARSLAGRMHESAKEGPALPSPSCEPGTMVQQLVLGRDDRWIPCRAALHPY